MGAMRSSGIAPVLTAMMILASAGPLVADPLAAGANSFAPQAGRSIAPLVPVSAFARPAGWLDSSRLRVSTTVSVGTGWGGRTDALQVTSLSYQLASPLAVRLSVGNAFGTGAVGSGRGMFLEGFAVAYRPHPSFQINVDYRDVRSPLQYSNPYSIGAFGR
jgi:hypothetical protein